MSNEFVDFSESMRIKKKIQDFETKIEISKMNKC